MVKRIILFLLLYFSTEVVHSPPNNNIHKVIIPLFHDMVDTYIDSIYNNCESRRYPYMCPAGKLTIGIGHQIVPTDTFVYPLSDSTIKELLRWDFYNKMYYVLLISPQLRGYKLIAITDFVCSVGQGTYKNSTLKDCVNNGGDVSKEIMRYTYYYAVDGTLTYDKNAVKKRIRQLNLYKQ